MYTPHPAVRTAMENRWSKHIPLTAFLLSMPSNRHLAKTKVTKTDGGDCEFSTALLDSEWCLTPKEWADGWRILLSTLR